MGEETVWSGRDIYLRNVCLNDTCTLLKWENNPKNWAISTTTEPYCEQDIVDFIVDQLQQINTETIREWRLIICTHNALPIGAIDLTEIDRQHKTAEVGILIAEPTHRNKGFGFQAIQGIKTIASRQLSLQKLVCSIQKHNVVSKKVFEKANFQKTTTSTDPTIDQYICVVEDACSVTKTIR